MCDRPIMRWVRRGLDAEGFTLLEALIAITLLIFMMLALWRSAAMIMNRNVENSLADEAVKIANEEIERLRNSPFTFTTGTTTSTVTRQVRNFTQTFNISDAFVVWGTVARVTVTVSWTYGGKTHSRQVVTVVANHG